MLPPVLILVVENQVDVEGGGRTESRGVVGVEVEV